MYEYVTTPQSNDPRIQNIADAFHAALSTTSPGAGLYTLVELLGKRYGAKRAYVFELPPDGREFLCTCEWCAPGVEPMSDVTHGLTMKLASRWFTDGDIRSILAIRNVSEVEKASPEYAALFRQRGMTSQVLGKLLRGNRPLGTLGFDDPAPELFDELCELMYPICAFATSTANTKNLLARMSTVGVVDKLTGAGTRMAFYARAENLPADAPMGMVYLDICGLKGINDVRGHDAGDELLIAIRQVLVTEFPDDAVFRMAGDEFLAVAIGMPEQRFRESCAHLRARLDDMGAYVAMGTSWQREFGTEYDAMVRYTWLECSNAKREWERRGGVRMGANSDEVDAIWRSSLDIADSGEGHLNIPCYHNDEFFRRANVWINHVNATRVGMVALDINYFKLYNDIFGREAGDLLLESFGGAAAHIAQEQHGVAGYLGGDNFAIIFPVPDNVDMHLLSNIIELDISKYDVAEGFSPAVGVVVTSELDTGISILYDRAQIALQEVKGNYTTHISFYNERRYERDRENQLLLIKAREGLAAGEFTFYLQPKVDISTNKIISAEALARWVHKGEVVPPFKFIDLMEESGHIFALDRYVWEKVCAWQRSLIDRGIEPVPISVNVSRVDFYFTDLAEHFRALAKRYDLDPRLLGIEVTESAYSKDANLINDVIRRMQLAGFLVFMDDFGSGYSSLNMLRSVAVDVLKMDKGFIDNANVHDGSDAIIENVINMAHRMGLPVISEGVETEDQRDALRAMDCDYVQGYFYWRPMPIADFEKILMSGDALELDHPDNIILSYEQRGMKFSCPL